MSEHRSVVIIGSGPAGYTAGIYAARAGLRPLLFEGTELGGALMTTSEVENYPGFPDGVFGPELMAFMRTQAEKVGVELITEDVTELELAPTVKQVRSASRAVETDAVVLAMGARTRTLGIPGETWAWNNGLSTCATCDGAFFKDQPVMVVGGGDAAVEEAITMSRIAASVTLVHRRSNFRASAVLMDRLASAPVEVRTGQTVKEILGGPKVSGVRLLNRDTGSTEDLAVDGLFVAIGQDPRSELVRGQVELTDSGHVRTGIDTMTSVPGVFASGDLVDRIYRQAITSAASGCQAALDAERWLTTVAKTVV